MFDDGALKRKLWQNRKLWHQQQKPASRGKPCKFPELEEDFFRYVTEVWNDGFALPTDMLHVKGLALACVKNIPARTFKASAGWGRRFLKKKGLSFW